jgi:phytoene dehydrogenase-like protein
LRTVVLERRELLGGATVTEEVWSGYRASTASYVVSHFFPRIVRDLGLKKYGYHVYPLDPAYFAPFPDGSGFLLWEDPRRAVEEIGRFNGHDGDAYPEYSRTLGELAELVRPLLYRRLPDPNVRSIADVKELLSLGRYAFASRKQLSWLVDRMTMSCADFLDQFFEDDRVKGALARGGVIGLYMCGSGTRKGGGVMGILGFNASRVAIRDAKREDRRKRLQRLSPRSKAFGEREKVS